MNVKLYKQLLAQSIQESIAYRSTSVIVAIFSVIFFVTEIVVGVVLFDQTSLLAGWSKQQYFMLIGVSALINSLYQFFFIVSHENLAESIIEGELDYIFLKPVNSFYFYAFNRIDLPSLVNTVLAVVLIISLQNRVHVLTLVFFILSILLSVWFLFLINQIIVTFSFWIEKGGKFLAIPEYLADIASKPYSIYPKMFIFLFTWICPFFLAFNMPVLLLKQTGYWKQLLYFLVFVFLLHKFATYLWRKGLKKYQSSN